MRIGIPMKSFDPTWGGPGTYTVELVNRLVAGDRRNEYVLVYPRDVRARVTSVAGPDADNVRQIGAGGDRSFLWDQVTLQPVCTREGIDVLFSPFMSIPVAGRFGKVFTIHGAERYMVPDMLPSDLNLKWLFMEKVLVRMADRLIVVSDTMGRDFCAKTGCPGEKVRAIHLGVSDEFRVVDDRSALSETRRKYALPEDFLLFVGRIFPNKNLSNLLRGFASIAARFPHKLVLAGGVRWKFAKELELIQELKLGDRVMVLGFISKQDLIHLYNLAACLCYPSYYESFGLVQLEAMACGCPVVAANTGALPEVAGDAAVFCDPHDHEDIGAAIARLVGDPAFRSRQIDKGLSNAKRYSWDRCAAQTLRVLQETASEAKR